MGKKMNLNIDTILAQKPAWDFVVTIGGHDYPTHFAEPDQVRGLANIEPNLSSLLKGILTFFDEPSPPPQLFNSASLSAFMAGYVSYLGKYQSAVLAAVHQNVQAEFEKYDRE